MGASLTFIPRFPETANSALQNVDNNTCLIGMTRLLDDQVWKQMSAETLCKGHLE